MKIKAFSVCRYYTVTAYLRHPGTPEWGGHQDCVRYAGTFLSRVHAGYLRPCDNGGATTGGRDHGCRAGGIAENYFYQNRGLGIPKPRFDVSHSGFIPVWVSVWVSPNAPRKNVLKKFRKQGKTADFWRNQRRFGCGGRI